MPFSFSVDTIQALKWLWFLPWTSAADIASIMDISDQSASNILNRARTRGWLLSARLGRVSDAVDRFVFSNLGTQEAQARWKWPLFWWHSPTGLRVLARRIELVEMAYRYLPTLWLSNLVSEPKCWVYEDRPGIAYRTGEPVMRAALVERDWRRAFLSRFYWMRDGPFEAVAIYDNMYSHDKFYLPVLWRGNFQTAADIANVRREMRGALIEDERWYKLPESQALAPEHCPPMVVFCTDRVSAAVAQRYLLESRNRETRTAAAIMDAQGQVVRPMSVPTSWWQDFNLPPSGNGRRLGNIARMVDGLTRGSYDAVNGRGEWRMFRALDGSPALSLSQISKSVGMDTPLARKTLASMVKAKVVISKKDSHYLDELGLRLLADSQHADIRLTNRRWAGYVKRRGEYRNLQRRHNQGQTDAVLYLRKHGFNAFPAMGVVIEYSYDRRRIRVTPDAFVILEPGVLVAVEFERSAKSPSRVKAKARNYQRLAQIGRPIPVLFITETVGAAQNFANLRYPYLLATTLESVKKGPHGRAVLEEDGIPGEPGNWFYWYNNRDAPTDDAAIDMWSQLYAQRYPVGEWRVPMDRPFRLVWS